MDTKEKLLSAWEDATGRVRIHTRTMVDLEVLIGCEADCSGQKEGAVELNGSGVCFRVSRFLVAVSAMSPVEIAAWRGRRGPIVKNSRFRNLLTEWHKEHCALSNAMSDLHLLEHYVIPGLISEGKISPGEVVHGKRLVYRDGRAWFE